MIKIVALALFVVLGCQMAFPADGVLTTDSAGVTEDAESDSEVFLMSNTCTWLSAGKNNMYDSYISPLLYKGSSLSLGHERLKYYSEHSDKFSQYMNFAVNLALAENPAKNATMSKFLFYYNYGAHYHLRPTDSFSLKLGGYSNVDLGVRLLMRNGNNPASAIVNSNLWFSAIGSYKIKARNRVVTLCNHLSVAVFGAMFSPKYTQTYFDIFYEGGSDGVVKLTSFGERFAIKNRFTVDVPLKKITFRAGFDAERTVTEVNLNETRDTQFTFLVGFVKNIYSFSGRERIPAGFKNPAE